MENPAIKPVGSVRLSLAALAACAAEHHLEILGGFNCADDMALPKGTQTLLLLGPAEPGFWAYFQAQAEWDGAADPVDRWSRRVIGRLACELGAKALFPFGGPPYQPFFQWALRTGRFWQSPVRLLVHDSQGLMVSFRGALALKERIEVPEGVAPCQGCAQPCLAACPVGALGAAGYDVPGCHAFLAGPAGANCMETGCGVRRACPASQSYARLPEQSTYHMGQFHK